MFTNNDKGMMGWKDLRSNLIESLNLDWYRGLFDAVNQEPVMFAGTIRCNLQLGVERTLADGDNEMPDRFDTDLGAVGKAVLGGQKQRLALSQSLDPSSGRSDECEKFLTALKAWRENHP
ncbi:hypothetical protein WA538_002440 [Blastocystis sp. DL]